MCRQIDQLARLFYIPYNISKSRINENTEIENRGTDVEKQEEYSTKQLESNSDRNDETEVGGDQVLRRRKIP